MKPSGASFLLRLLLVVAVLAAWEGLVVLFAIPAFILPAPSSIFTALYRGFASSLYVDHVWITLEETLLGFAFGTALAFCLGIAVALSRRVEYFLYPFIVMFQAMPKVALAPIFILWFGYDLAPKVLLILVIAFFPITLNMLAGLESVERGFVSLMRSVGATENDILLRVRIPHALPQLMSGVKIAITFCIIGAIVGEFAGASAGLGYVIQFASTQLETPLVFAALVVVSAVGVGFYYVSELLEKLIVPWAPQFDATDGA